MGFKRLVSETFRQGAKKRKDVKAKHKGKDWATLNTNDKFEVIGDDLKARGVID